MLYVQNFLAKNVCQIILQLFHSLMFVVKCYKGLYISDKRVKRNIWLEIFKFFSGRGGGSQIRSFLLWFNFLPKPHKTAAPPKNFSWYSLHFLTAMKSKNLSSWINNELYLRHRVIEQSITIARAKHSCRQDFELIQSSGQRWHSLHFGVLHKNLKKI